MKKIDIKFTWPEYIANIALCAIGGYAIGKALRPYAKKLVKNVKDEYKEYIDVKEGLQELANLTAEYEQDNEIYETNRDVFIQSEIDEKREFTEVNGHAITTIDLMSSIYINKAVDLDRVSNILRLCVNRIYLKNKYKSAKEDDYIGQVFIYDDLEDGDRFKYSYEVYQSKKTMSKAVGPNTDKIYGIVVDVFQNTVGNPFEFYCRARFCDGEKSLNENHTGDNTFTIKKI